MALSNGNSFSGPLIFLNPRSKTDKGVKVAPHFEIAKVGEDKKIQKTGETCTNVRGDLLRPRFTTRDYEGQPIKHVVLYIQDKAANEGKGETYSLDLTYRIASRQLFNAILSLTDPKGILISIYENKKGYETLSLGQGEGDRPPLVAWKYDSRKGEIPEAVEGPMFKGKRQFDYDPVDNFFEAELKAWADAIFGEDKGKSAAASKTSGSAPANTGTKTKSEPAKEEKQPEPAGAPAGNGEPDSDLPF